MLQDTKKVSLIFVGSKDGLSESSFGHIALRFSPAEELGPFDSNIQFVAKLPQKEFFLKKYAKGFGVFGNYAYDVAIELDSFTNYQAIKRRKEDRDLYVLPLKLNQNQINRLISYIKNFYDEGVKKYRFFNRNCSYFAADAIEYALQTDLKAKSFPWRVGSVLKEAGFVSDELYYPSNTNSRHQVIGQMYDHALSLRLSLLKEKKLFIRDIESENLNIKSDSYFTLLSLLKSLKDEANHIHFKEFEDYYLSLASKEKEEVQSYFKAIIKNLDAFEMKRVTSSFSFKSGIHGLPREVSNDLKIIRDQAVVDLSWENKGQQASSSTRLPLPFLNYNKQTGAVTHEGIEVARHLMTRKHDWIAATGINYSVSLRPRQNAIHSRVLLFKNKKTTQSTEQKIIDNGHLALNNMVDFDGSDTLGACLAMVKLQKSFHERVVFNPQAEWSSDYDKLELLKEVISGKFVIIPGFDNINDFTASIPKSDFIEFISGLQKGLNSNPRQAFLDGLFEYQEVKRKTFKNFVFLLNAGHAVELVIGMKKKGARRYEQVSHVVLVHHIKTREDASGWDLFIYDPNLGHITIKMTPDYLLEFPVIYRKDLVYNGVLYKKNRQAIDFDLGMRSLNLNMEKLERRSSRGRPLFFSPLNYSY